MSSKMKTAAIKLIIVVLSIFAPVKGIMISAMVLILCDLVTGVMAAKKQGHPINSSGFQRTLVKLMVYETAIALGFIAQHYLMGDILPICNIIGSYVGLTELTSAYENINTISGGNLLKQVLQTLNSKNSELNDHNSEDKKE